MKFRNLLGHHGSTMFVTVGTTKFDKLIQSITSQKIAVKLRKLGISKLILQVGKSNYDLESIKALEENYKFKIDLYDYKPSIQDDIMRADLVVGHAGAGTCLDVLRQNKRLLIVANDSLMGKHQDELADELVRHNYVLKTTLDDLDKSIEFICDNENFKLSPFPQADPSKFETIFNEQLEKIRISEKNLADSSGYPSIYTMILVIVWLALAIAAINFAI